jgi:hypothetical protein
VAKILKQNYDKRNLLNSHRSSITPLDEQGRERESRSWPCCNPRRGATPLYLPGSWSPNHLRCSPGNRTRGLPCRDARRRSHSRQRQSCRSQRASEPPPCEMLCRSPVRAAPTCASACSAASRLTCRRC